MTIADNASGPAGQSRAALLIAGGGVMGLWAALKAERLGIDTLLVDAGRLAEGASGGLLGALMPHMPDKWNDKKQFQFDALLSLEDEVCALEAETGRSAGYRRSGRLIPLPKPHLRTIAERHEREALVNWRAGDRSFRWNAIDVSPFGPDWPTPEVKGAGLVHDTFAARVSPRGLTGMLVERLRRAKNVRIVEGCGVERIEGTMARLTDGTSIAFGHCIVSAGHRSFPLLEMLGPPLSRPLGQPVKGQAALMKGEIDPDLPLLYLDGLYIVPHEGGLAAIGSTSEDRFDEPFTTDGQIEDLIARARLLAPVLKSSEVVERWAGLRPKAIDRDPMVGPHPDNARVVALTGGFKVSFGMAHRLAEEALGAVQGRPMTMPDGFHLASHVAVATRNA
ncbi:MAG: FAD-binding oxidoreductase [Alphaproteobacteria bacterium]|nr:FAD-binding oxidoreductase [Rhizobiaceae bacterium]MBU3962471.1 FAD-binding oxidoreductase [Alphaproteobacteria bacterium]MBU4052479.1 FAD-binding oxidoreductase [Alphaproteobacteria bacterium]MBU4090173.1 FAD-binding oxidoreductase [Alphaproteobacteria bacterium]MBU4156504.1 FAD-binding oxidoreductase [Alphaproteobacteria bacterium]